MRGGGVDADGRAAGDVGVDAGLDVGGDVNGRSFDLLVEGSWGRRQGWGITGGITLFFHRVFTPMARTGGEIARADGGFRHARAASLDHRTLENLVHNVV